MLLLTLGLIKGGYFWSGSLNLAAKRKSCSRQSGYYSLIKGGYFWSGSLNLAAKRKSCSRQSGYYMSWSLRGYRIQQNLVLLNHQQHPEDGEGVSPWNVWKTSHFTRMCAREHFVKFSYHANFKLERKQDLNLNTKEENLGLEYSAVWCGNQ